MSNKLHISQFYKNKPSFYKLTNKQVQQLINYISNNCTQEELNQALGYMSHCPYCNSQDFYKMDAQSHLYKFKCEQCRKEFNILSRSSIAHLLRKESIKRNQRFRYKQALKNIEVWLHFDIEHDRKYNTIPRKNTISTTIRWKHNMLQIPKDLKKDQLVNIHERDEESFSRLVDEQIRPKMVLQKNQSHKKFIILTFQEGRFTPKKSIMEYENPFKLSPNSTLDTYLAEDKKKKFQLEYDSLKNMLIQSYSEECEILRMPSRDDQIYKNIEIPYKHTYSLAYEMAIRNEVVKKILYALKYLKYLKKNFQFMTNTEYKESAIQKLHSRFPNFLSIQVHQYYISTGIYNINSMIDDFEDELRKAYLIVPKDNKIVTPESSRILMQRITHNSIDPKKMRWYPSNQQELKYRYEEKQFDDYTISMGVFEGDDVFDVSVIRQTFNLHLIDKNTFLVPINFTSPTEEIVAFIEKIKKDFKDDSN
ncbi:hypothetical protein KKG72_01625 [bacterium]|nr:hypothetical protein [bacterium]MBU1993181.1 hypothetical protein [bacterium]